MSDREAFYVSKDGRRFEARGTYVSEMPATRTDPPEWATVEDVAVRPAGGGEWREPFEYGLQPDDEELIADALMGDD